MKTYIYNDRYSSIVQSLGAVRPEVRTLGQINVAGTQTREGERRKEEGGKEREISVRSKVHCTCKNKQACISSLVRITCTKHHPCPRLHLPRHSLHLSEQRLTLPEVCKCLARGTLGAGPASHDLVQTC